MRGDGCELTHFISSIRNLTACTTMHQVKVQQCCVAATPETEEDWRKDRDDRKAASALVPLQAIGFTALSPCTESTIPHPWRCSHVFIHTLLISGRSAKALLSPRLCFSQHHSSRFYFLGLLYSPATSCTGCTIPAIAVGSLLGKKGDIHHRQMGGVVAEAPPAERPHSVLSG